MSLLIYHDLINLLRAVGVTKLNVSVLHSTQLKSVGFSIPSLQKWNKCSCLLDSRQTPTASSPLPWSLMSSVYVCFDINLAVLTQSSRSPCGLTAWSEQRFFTGVCHFYGPNRVSEREGPQDDCLILSSQKKHRALIDSTAVSAIESINHDHLHPSPPNAEAKMIKNTSAGTKVLK